MIFQNSVLSRSLRRQVLVAVVTEMKIRPAAGAAD